MTAHYDLYEDLGLDRFSSCQQIDEDLRTRFDEARAEGKPAGDPLVDKLRVAGRVLTAPWRREIYDEKLDDPAADAVTIAELRRIAAIPRPAEPAGTVPRPAEPAGTVPRAPEAPADAEQTVAEQPIQAPIGLKAKAQGFSDSLPNTSFNNRYSAALRLGLTAIFAFAALGIVLSRAMKWQLWQSELLSTDVMTASVSGLGWISVDSEFPSEIFPSEVSDALSASRVLVIFPTLTTLVTVALLAGSAYVLHRGRHTILAVATGLTVMFGQFLWATWNTFNYGIPATKWVLLPAVVTGQLDGEDRAVFNEVVSDLKGDGISESIYGLATISMRLTNGPGPMVAMILLVLLLIAAGVVLAMPVLGLGAPGVVQASNATVVNGNTGAAANGAAADWRDTSAGQPEQNRWADNDSAQNNAANNDEAPEDNR